LSATSEAASKQGTTVAAGGKRPAGAAFARGYYFEPTVFTNVSPQMRIAQEEIFGPVVRVMSFNSEDEAVAIANGTQFGLGASVWTRDGARAHWVAHRLQFGIVWINDHHRVDPASPWGGFKMSGI
jgi:phenylacetaldehyde dehydrogenase